MNGRCIYELTVAQASAPASSSIVPMFAWRRAPPGTAETAALPIVADLWMHWMNVDRRVFP
jgi:hypothetical protein